jgi:(p)ppGpp synthase/HD superfamily hydrolase
VLSGRFEEALRFVLQLHGSQLRKGTQVPYIAHLLGVASIALENGANENEAIAALLHDAIEDQGGASTREEIRRRFGEQIVNIVDGCTDTDVTPKPPWRQRKEAYLLHIRSASPSVRLVSASDKLNNARCILSDYRVSGEALWDRFAGGKEGTLWYYRRLVEELDRVGPSALVEELNRVVSEIESLSKGDGSPV